LQDFLKQLAQKQKSGKGNECIFCSIASGKISSMKIAETNNFTAVLDINPASEGHLLIIPRKHVESFEKVGNKAELIRIIEELSKKIKNKLGALDVAILISSAGHLIIQLIPIYEDTVLQFPRKKFEREKMEEIADKLKTEIKIDNNKTDNNNEKETKSKKVESWANGGENNSLTRESEDKTKKPEKLEKRSKRIP